ncbi:hypothetical protein RND81_07G179400 [Saponaria officinalis]|uniref:F-box domain-containing protein n=1 Tax=Saponaria officinalis TaxID=3572 RepID=A0AAW1JRJ6_SAPOF
MEAPHEALFLVLAYLPLHQLLTMSQVSKTLHDAINSDVLVWLHLVVENPLNLRLTDDTLMRFASKAHGRLHTLALLNCFNITDDCLIRVINANLLLTKLYVPACTGLTPEIILAAAKTLTKLKQVKIDGIYNLKQEHLLELTHYLPQTTSREPKFYHKFQIRTFQRLEEDRSSIDVEECPKCKEVKLVFDCPRETCTTMKRSVVACRGCSNCITRCEGCGKCISDEDDEELGETICNDFLCLDCWLRLPKCSHCNKSYCPTHLDQQLFHFSISRDFVCLSCEMKQSR